MTIVHTSHHQAGQIYIPQVNQLLAIGTLVLVFTFQDADRLASAYGIAVTGTMGITSILFHVVATREWKWPWFWTTLLTLSFLSVDAAFFLSNIFKIKRSEEHTSELQSRL